ncbi:hypothetical protein ACFQ5J_06085 [Lacticaseibacillus baoqingensis]|uniref:YtxH domain-containing protein n=1 Tax=Lacticaseibacillus baoqingensis TaxID=2486013 RepID=A0ABW4E894_9LACO|nr:hypothetical protein [Lacticaseibacillus baoqingensis]
MQKWPYSELSHAAKEAGGPEALIQKIKDAANAAGYRNGLNIGKQQGLVTGSMATLAAVSLVGGGAYAVKKYRDHLRLQHDSSIKQAVDDEKLREMQAESDVAEEKLKTALAQHDSVNPNDPDTQLPSDPV